VTRHSAASEVTGLDVVINGSGCSLGGTAWVGVGAGVG